MNDEPRKDDLLSDLQKIALQGFRDIFGSAKPGSPADGDRTGAETADFTEIGRQAFCNGDPAAPTRNTEVREALVGMAVASAEGRKIMADFTAGWTAANLASDVDGSIWSPDDLVAPPLYEGQLDQAHTKLVPGRYEATDAHDKPVVVEVTKNATTVTRLAPDQ
jgi:hypothetical protein